MTAPNQPSLLSGREAVVFNGCEKARDETSGVVKASEHPTEEQPVAAEIWYLQLIRI